MNFTFGKDGCSDISVVKLEPICSRPKIKGTAPMLVGTTPHSGPPVALLPESPVCFSFTPIQDATKLVSTETQPANLKVSIVQAHDDCGTGVYSVTAEGNIPCVPGVVGGKASSLSVRYENGDPDVTFSPQVVPETDREDCDPYVLNVVDVGVGSKEITIPCVPTISPAFLNGRPLKFLYETETVPREVEYRPKPMIKHASKCEPYALGIESNIDSVTIPCVPKVVTGDSNAKLTVRYEGVGGVGGSVTYSPKVEVEGKGKCEDRKLSMTNTGDSEITIPCVPEVRVSDSAAPLLVQYETDSGYTDRIYSPVLSGSHANKCDPFNISIANSGDLGGMSGIKIPCVPKLTVGWSDASLTLVDENNGDEETVFSPAVELNEGRTPCSPYSLRIKNTGSRNGNRVRIPCTPQFRAAAPSRGTISVSGPNGESGSGALSAQVTVTPSGTTCKTYEIGVDIQDVSISMSGSDEDSSPSTPVSFDGIEVQDSNGAVFSGVKKISFATASDSNVRLTGSLDGDCVTLTVGVYYK